MLSVALRIILVANLESQQKCLPCASSIRLVSVTQPNVKYISVACAILHNLAIIFRGPLIDEDCDVDGSFQGQKKEPEDGKISGIIRLKITFKGKDPPPPLEKISHKTT